MTYLGTSPCAIHDGMASVNRKLILELGQTFSLKLISAVNHPPIGLHENGWSQVFISIPPVAGTGGAAACAHDTFIQTVLRKKTKEWYILQ